MRQPRNSSDRLFSQFVNGAKHKNKKKKHCGSDRETKKRKLFWLAGKDLRFSMKMVFAPHLGARTACLNCYAAPYLFLN